MSLDWEYQYQTQQTPWEKGAPAPPLLEWLDHHPETISGRLLVPGCGTGHDVRALAGQTKASPLVGLDVSETALEIARSHAPAGNETYLLDDLFVLPESQGGTYDWVFEHTCFCAILPSQREDYVEAVHQLLKPGGQLLAVFFLDPYDDDHPPGGGPPHGTSLDELQERFEASGRFQITESYEPNRAYEGREGLEQVMRMIRSSNP
ncbi:MAG: methyltransferase domain-containing protein [Verrucomicrobiota bacterium]